MIKRLLIPTAILALGGCAAIPNHYTSSDWLGDGRFTDGVEGPAVDRGGRLYAVNFERQGTIGVSQVRGQGRLYVTLPEGSTGNAIRFTDDGHMLVADYTGHKILKVDTRTREVSVYAHSDEMHQPNDLVIADDGTVYASDPNWADGTGQLWRIDPGEAPERIESGMGTTNGIELSPDGRTLYVNESVQRVIWAYDRAADGSLSNKRAFHRFAEHGLDGMSVDVDGNLYVARYGAGEIAILNPSGKLRRTVALTGQHPTNLTFGGPEGKRVFVTMQKRGAIETFTVPTPGSDWTKARQ